VEVDIGTATLKIRDFPSHEMPAIDTIDIRWFDFVSNIDVLGRTGLTSLNDIPSARLISVFGHIARLENDVPVHMALRRHVA